MIKRDNQDDVTLQNVGELAPARYDGYGVV